MYTSQLTGATQKGRCHRPSHEPVAQCTWSTATALYSCVFLNHHLSSLYHHCLSSSLLSFLTTNDIASRSTIDDSGPESSDVLASIDVTFM